MNSTEIGGQGVHGESCMGYTPRRAMVLNEEVHECPHPEWAQ